MNQMAMNQRYVKPIKWGLDLLMGIVFALLFNARVLGGIAFHEFAGLALGAAVLCHLLLNGKWILKVSKMILSRQLNARTRFNYLLSVLLLLDFLIILLSGINISKVALPLNLHLPYLGKGIHLSASYIGLGLIGIHVGLHWKWVMTTTQRIVRGYKPTKLTSVLSKALAVLVLAMGIYQMNQTGFVPKTLQGFSVAQGFEDYGKAGDRPNRVGKEKSYASRGQSGEKRPDKNHGSESPLQVVFTFGSMMGAFSVAAYYLDQAVQKRRHQ